ncbi:MAG: dUTP diphosphatase [Candidatus Firestonebacteria bacterium]|nr:dUTP diphosphatase [Candidatus Firestonebacteria bacterium]
MSINVKVKMLSQKGKLPLRKNVYDAGADLFSAEKKEILPGEYALIKTDIAVHIPSGFVGLVWPRSGLAIKYGIDTLAGVIDSEYRENVCILLHNHGKEPFIVEPGMRIAQLLIQHVEQAVFLETQELNETSRGKGFGSTGVF